MATTLVDAKAATAAFRELMIFSGLSPILAAEVREFLDHHPVVAKINVVIAPTTGQRIKLYQPSDPLQCFLAALRAKHGELNDKTEFASDHA